MYRKVLLCCCLCVGSSHIVVAQNTVGMDHSPNSSAPSFWYQDLLLNGVTNKCYQTWILSILASCVVGLTGIIPLIFVPIESESKLNQQGGSKFLRLLLSFAVGGLLGDVFLHLLPEAWNHIESLGPEMHSKHLTLGLWVLLGMFSFVILEIMFAASKKKRKYQKITTPKASKNAFRMEKKRVAQNSSAMGIHLTMRHIRIHTKRMSGFNPWNAAKAQISTATIGILGAVVALSSDSADKLGSCTSWILPFTSGGFLNIALVNVLPDLLKEKDPWESMKQMLCLCGGIGVMALVNVFSH
ncbi:Zinc transporter ZIP13 like protein [Argiope bruennichi]|uniref:Zinc transporter ZIP13 like protein n=1 Tax=Argiope bruennichi TaxID=94029 RepID=A0A8T0E8F3_ARGBR|nr:Zinc transporter ZIP13 like protein [Argiope bruennichi]